MSTYVCGIRAAVDFKQVRNTLPWHPVSQPLRVMYPEMPCGQGSYSGDVMRLTVT